MLFNFINVSAAADLQPSLSYFIQETGRPYKSYCTLYDELMPRKVPLGDYMVFSTCQEEMALNYKLFENNSLKRGKGRKKNQEGRNLFQETLNPRVLMSRYDSTHDSVGMQSMEQTADMSIQETTSSFTEENNNNLTHSLEMYISEIEKMINNRIEEVNFRFKEKENKLKQEIGDLTRQLEIRQSKLLELEKVRAALINDFKRKIFQRIDTSFS